MTFAIVGGGQLDTGYTIDNSLRFNDDDSPDLSRTPGSGGNRDTFTTSFWIKRGNLGSGQRIWSAGTSIGTNNNDVSSLLFESNDTLKFFGEVSGSPIFTIQTNQVFRDVGAWYHIVLAVDSTQATSSNRIKIYVNGSQITSFSTETYMSQNTDTYFNATNLHVISYNGGGFVDGYIAEFHHIDGQQLSPTDFGEFDADSGIWKPIRYTGTYGTNGFYLDFEDSGSLGADQSGNSNNFTPTNLASTDQMLDTPTNNFCTLNRVAAPQNVNFLTFSEGNLKVECPTSDRPTLSTFGMSSGKWYFEAYVIGGSNDHWIGVWKNDEALNGYGSIAQTTSASLGLACVYQGNTGGVGYNGSTEYTGSSYTGGDYIGCCFDADNYKVYFHKNGIWQNSADPSAGTGGVSVSDGEWLFYIAANNSGQGWIANFGQDSTFAGTTTAGGNADENGYGDFKYTVESGFLSLNSANLATELSPTIDEGSEYFNTVLYTGTGSSLGVTGVGFQPDWTWIKGRSGATEHVLTDSSRGVTEELSSNDNGAEETVAQGLTAFGTDGFTVGTDGSYNTSSATYVAWNWLANGGTTSSNTDGSITSTVQADTTAGFSIVTYTGNATGGATVGHGLGKKPDMIIAKNRNTTGPSRDWLILHKAYEGTSAENMRFTTMALASAGSQAGSGWYRTAPTSSVFYLGDGSAGDYSGDTNISGANHVAYCFAEIKGYSKFGSYIGNGNNNGTFVYTGFSPAFTLIKRTNSTGEWPMHDNARNPSNVVDKYLWANQTDAEGISNIYDRCANGFKLRGTSLSWNASGSTYIYMAFAENPFVSSTSIPLTAR